MNENLDFPNITPHSEMKFHDNSVDCIRLAPGDDSKAVTGSHDHTLKFWDLKAEKVTQSVTPHAEGVWNLDFHPTGNVVLSVSPSSTVTFTDVKNGKTTKTLKDHSNKVYAARFNSQGTQFVTSDRDNNLYIWDYAKAKVIQKLQPPTQGFMFFCDFSPDGRYVVGTTFKNEIVILDTTNMQFTDVQQIEPLEENCDLGYFVSFSKTQPNTFLTSHEDHRMRLWQIQDGGKLALSEIIEGHHGAVRSTAFNSSENRLVSSCADHSLRIWDYASRTPLCILTGHTDIVAQCDVGKTTPIVVSAGWDQMVRVWNVAEYL